MVDRTHTGYSDTFWWALLMTLTAVILTAPYARCM